MDRGAILGRFGMGAQAEELVKVVVSVENNFPVCKFSLTAIAKPDFTIFVSNIRSIQKPQVIADL